MVSGGPRGPLLQHFARNVFQCGFRNDFFTICDRFGLQKGSQGRAHEGPTNQLFRHFFDSAPLGGPLGHPGLSNDLKGHKNDTEMTPMFLAWDESQSSRNMDGHENVTKHRVKTILDTTKTVTKT